MIEITNYLKDQIHSGNNVTAKMCAEKFAYEYRYFSKFFKKNMGCSYSNYITALKMELAVYYVLSDIKISKIHHQLHYNSFSSFSRGFKNQMGLAPLKFRELTQVIAKQFQNIYIQDEEKHMYFSKDLLDTSLKNTLDLSFTFPEGVHPRVMFIGLYEERLALGNPICGVAIFNNNSATLSNIPNGNYYVLVSAYEVEHDIVEMFLASRTTKGCTRQSLSFEGDSKHQVSIHLDKQHREYLPAVINFPLLLLNQ